MSSVVRAREGSGKVGKGLREGIGWEGGGKEIFIEICR